MPQVPRIDDVVLEWELTYPQLALVLRVYGQQLYPSTLSVQHNGEFPFAPIGCDKGHVRIFLGGIHCQTMTMANAGGVLKQVLQQPSTTTFTLQGVPDPVPLCISNAAEMKRTAALLCTRDALHVANTHVWPYLPHMMYHVSRINAYLSKLEFERENTDVTFEEITRRHQLLEMHKDYVATIADTLNVTSHMVLSWI